MRLLFLFLLLTYHARLTPKEAAQARIAADLADLQIRHLDYSQVREAISTGTWVILLGALWCINTQIFTPKFLQVQKLLSESDITGIHMAKIECSTDEEQFCNTNFKFDG